MDFGANINLENNEGATALLIAAIEEKNLDAIFYLLIHDANTNNSYKFNPYDVDKHEDCYDWDGSLAWVNSTYSLKTRVNQQINLVMEKVKLYKDKTKNLNETTSSEESFNDMQETLIDN